MKRYALTVLLTGIVLAGAGKQPFSKQNKAFYSSPAALEFIRPGLQLKIASAQIASDGTISANYSITDPKGISLDRDGVNTPGLVAVSFIAAVIPKGEEQYVAYTTRAAAGKVIATTQQAGADTGGVTVKLADGQYRYTFATKARLGFDANATHTIGAYSSRNLTEFDLGTNYASATYNFVPDGSKVVQVRDVVKNESCNNCHDQISSHGGSRRGVELCVVCHTPQTINPNTGNTTDFNVMVHKIHMGSQLPSVIGGTPYQILPTRGGVNDWSTVVYPADPRRCETCHAQSEAYLNKPTRASCGSCHDDVNFTTGEKHAGGRAVSDNQCAMCHIPQGELEFDASIKGSHVVPTESSLLSGLLVELKSVARGTAGSAPVVTFTVRDKSGSGVPTARLGNLSLTMGGPNSDAGYVSFGEDVTTPGFVTEIATSATCDAGGTCVYTFRHAVPADATGSYRIAIEARRTEVLLAGTTKQMSVTYGATNQFLDFSVDGSKMAPRRTVVTTASCNQCHIALSAHGGLRNNTEYCVMCHNPSETDLSRRPTAVVAAERRLPPQGVNFNLMIHRIHSGEHVVGEGGKPYVAIGFGGSQHDFSEVRYPVLSPQGAPGDRRNCSMCHVGDSETILPTGLKAVRDPQGPIPLVQPITSACTGCHVSIPAASHALVNTSQLGESCEVCHGRNADYSVGKVHAQ